MRPRYVPTGCTINFFLLVYPKANQYDSLNEDGKNPLRMMKTPVAMFKNLCKKIKTELIRAKLDSKEKVKER